MQLPRLIKALFGSAAIVALCAPNVATAADPVEIPTILSLTGTGAFVGTGQQQSIQLLEAAINKNGGINGRPVHFDIKDDQSNPAVAIQLTQAVIAQKANVLLGPSITGDCNAATPLVSANGPLTYCLTAGAAPAPGGYVFATLTPTPDLLAVAMRYFHDRGWKKIAYIVPSDAGGQDAEKGIIASSELPENKGIEIVDRERIGPTDISASAQIAKMRAASPDAVIAWATGTVGGTILHGFHDAGWDVPVVLSPGNMTATFGKQFGALLTDQMFMPAMSFFAGPSGVDAKTRAAIGQITAVYKAANLVPDQIALSAWDPASLLVETLRRAGPDAPPAKLRDTLANIRDYGGVNGLFDFTKYPQRGLGAPAVLVIRYDPTKDAYIPVSRLGGAPLGR